MPYWSNSQAVSRAPCRRGRVSSTRTWMRLPCSCAVRITPSAVPQSTVASAPVLQWWMIVSPSSISFAPCSAIRLLISTSSSAMRCAASKINWRTSSGLRSSFVWSTIHRIRSTAQAKLTAVGRALFRVSAALCKSFSRSSVELLFDSYPASARPKAAAAPIAGAPRTTISLIAYATEAWSLKEMTSKRPGRIRWSIIFNWFSSQNTVRMRGILPADEQKFVTKKHYQQGQSMQYYAAFTKCAGLFH